MRLAGSGFTGSISLSRSLFADIHVNETTPGHRADENGREIREKNKEKTKEKHTHRYREQTSGDQWGEGMGRGGDGEIKRHKLLWMK